MVGDPLPSTVNTSLSYNDVPRRFPLPEGIALGAPPPLDASLVAAPVLADAEATLDPVAAEIARTIRGAIAGSPEVLRAIAKNLPNPGQVLTGAGVGLGAASLAAGLTGEAAKLLTPATAAIPYVGAAVAAWGVAAPIASAALGALGAGYGALGQTLQGIQNPVDISGLLSQWGKLLPNGTAAIPPPPTAV